MQATLLGHGSVGCSALTVKKLSFETGDGECCCRLAPSIMHNVTQCVQTFQAFVTNISFFVYI